MSSGESDSVNFHYRPWEPLGMTTKKWMEIDPEVIDLRECQFAQQTVTISGLLRAINSTNWASVGGDEFIHIVEWDENLWVEDGHHRAIIHLIRGQFHTVVRVFRPNSDK